MYNQLILNEKALQICIGITKLLLKKLQFIPPGWAQAPTEWEDRHNKTCEPREPGSRTFMWKNVDILSKQQ